MAVDTPAKIAVIGAGPVGLEVALYARYLGYDVDLYEQGRACESLLSVAHLQAWEPWVACTSPLGRASLTNQDTRWQPPADDATLTFGELAERYFLPLSRCDLLSDCLQEQTTVLAVGREGLQRGDFLQDDRRIDVPFRLIVRDAEGAVRAENADVVFDCSGISIPGFLGNGGLPAVGELACRERIHYALPDLLGRHKAEFVGKRVLVVGEGSAAARIIADFAKLAIEDAKTQVTWSTRTQLGESGPVPESADDPAPGRAEVARRANQLALQSGGFLQMLAGSNVEALEHDGELDEFAVQLWINAVGHEEYDRIIAAVPRRPDVTLWSELQMLVCPCVEAPLPMADFLRRQAGEPSPDAASRRRALAQAVLNPEPDFYVLGSKSWGRRGDDFLFSAGHEQIVALFTVIGDRETLDLYASRFAAQ
ncbi:MAG: hypothetical protein QM775_07175 [Pirellulales bacterium]